MGRFYKTARAQQIDYGMKLPLEYMAAAVANKDAQIDDTLSKEQALKAALMQQRNATKTTMGRGGYLPSEAETYKQEINKYQEQIDDISTKIKGDLFNSYQQNASIADLTTDIQSSMTTGNLSVLQANMESLQGFAKENKDISPEILEASIEKIKSDWGGKSINEDGTYNMLSESLPSSLYDVNVYDEAFKLANKGDKTLAINKKAALITSNLYEQDDLRRTLEQNLDLGLLRDAEGNVIDASELTPENRREVIYNEINRNSTKAAEYFKQKPKINKGNTIPKDKNTYVYNGTISTSPGDEGIKMNTLVGKVNNKFNTDKENPIGVYNAMSMQIEENKAILKNDALEGNNTISEFKKTRLIIENGILQNLQKQAENSISYEKLHMVLQTAPLGTKPDMYRIQQELRDKYIINNMPTDHNVPMNSGWDKPTSDDDRKLVEEEVFRTLESAVSDKMIVYSDNPEYNGKTIGNIKTENYTNENEKIAAEEALTVLRPGSKLTDADEGKEILYQKKHTKTTVEDGYWVLNYQQWDNVSKYIDGPDPQRIEIKYDDFKINKAVGVKPSSILNNNGNIGYRFEALIGDKKEVFYLGENDVQSTDIDAIMNTTERRNALKADYLYNTMLNNGIPEGEQIVISPGVNGHQPTIIVNKDGKLVLSLYIKKIDDIYETNDIEEITQHLKTLID